MHYIILYNALTHTFKNANRKFPNRAVTKFQLTGDAYRLPYKNKFCFA